jgi:hypothetical protein
MDPVDGALPISVTLSAAEWNQVLDLVANGPWRAVDPLMKAISKQVFEAASLAARPPAAALNGAEGAHVSD